MKKIATLPTSAGVLSTLIGTVTMLLVAALVWIIGGLNGVGLRTIVMRSLLSACGAGLVVRWISLWVFHSILEDWRRIDSANDRKGTTS